MLTYSILCGTTAMRSPSLHPVSRVANILIGLFALSLVLFAYERALTPIYASYPTTHLLLSVVFLAIILAALQPTSQFSLTRIWLCNAFCLSLAPNATYWVAVLTARQRMPILGPLATHILVLAPLVFLLTLSVSDSTVGVLRLPNTV